MAQKKRPRKSPMSLVSGSVFTKKKAGSATVLEQPAQVGQLSAGTPQKRTCFNTKYATFIKVYVTGEYNRVGGEEAWLDIMDEYGMLIKTEKSDTALDLLRKITYCNWQLKVVEVALSIGGLRDLWRPKLAEALTEAGFSYVKNLDDDKKYQKQLDK